MFSANGRIGVFRSAFQIFPLELSMKSHLLAAVFSLCISPLLAVHAAEDPPADPSLAKDQAKAVSAAVTHDAKVVADAAKKGAKQVAETAKQVAHEVAAASKEGAQEVAATAKKGAANAKAAVNGEKTATPPAKPAGKAPATPDKTPAP
jgi:hypothetical protein